MIGGMVFPSTMSEQSIRCSKLRLIHARRHWVVWTLLPLVDWTTADGVVSNRGLSGRRVFRTRPSDEQDDITNENIDSAGNASQPVCEEILAFARSRWSEADELAFIVNPVKLQSVPGLVSALLCYT